MRKGLLISGLLLVLLMGMTWVYADDSTPKPGTPEDNECNPGGVLYREENQDGCPNLWYWKAGWFLARFNRGLISREDFPKEFESVLPPLNKDENSLKTICGSGLDDSDLWIGCFNSDQTGSETVNGDLEDYVVFVNNSSECPLSFNGVSWTTGVDTGSYIIDFYLFSDEELASIGGLRPVTCLYMINTR